MSLRLILAALLAAPLAAQDAPYAGQDARAIAALSEDDIAALMSGVGWGFAKAAELNGYPGPAHVLEMADELDLSDAQRARVQAIFDAMNAEARALGAEYVAAEATLDALFADGAPDAARLTALTAEAAGIRGRLRAVHLAAHLETAPILTRHQRVMYARARGYDAGHGHAGH